MSFEGLVAKLLSILLTSTETTSWRSHYGPLLVVDKLAEGPFVKFAQRYSFASSHRSLFFHVPFFMLCSQLTECLDEARLKNDL